MFIYVKNYITCAELWVDEVYGMIAVEVKGRDPKITWEILGIYRVLNEDMQALEKLSDRTGYFWSTTKHSITGGDLNLLYAGWNGQAKNLGEPRYFYIEWYEKTVTLR